MEISPTKRVNLTIDQKIQLIEDSMKPGFSQNKAAQALGVTKSCVSKIMKKKFEYYCHPRRGSIGTNKILSKGKNDYLEQKLYQWYLGRLEEEGGSSVSGLEIKNKAKHLANSSECSGNVAVGFKFSDRWLDGFKKRHNIYLNSTGKPRKKKNVDESFVEFSDRINNIKQE